MIDGQKMSKSLGNVISPQQLVDLFGVDGSRYLIARSFPSENDSDVGIGRFSERYNADLANNLGNLVSRVAKLALGRKVEKKGVKGDREFGELVDQLKLDEAIGWVFEKYIDASNSRLNSSEPWKLETDDPKRVEVLDYCIDNLIKAAVDLAAVMPESAKIILDCFEGEVKAPEKGLFARIK